MNEIAVKRWTRLCVAVQKKAEARFAAFVKAFPVGSTVEWMHGYQDRRAVVIDHRGRGFGDERLVVRGQSGGGYEIGMCGVRLVEMPS